MNYLRERVTRAAAADVAVTFFAAFFGLFADFVDFAGLPLFLGDAFAATAAGACCLEAASTIDLAFLDVGCTTTTVADIDFRLLLPTVALGAAAGFLAAAGAACFFEAGAAAVGFLLTGAAATFGFTGDCGAFGCSADRYDPMFCYDLLCVCVCYCVTKVQK